MTYICQKSENKRTNTRLFY